ncbi:MAG: hypothetical protein K6B75_03510, partial [Lachnospiraceae bacterium]|nr:hypothetical protein [Lachnospiraceae bacterium]
EIVENRFFGKREERVYLDFEGIKVRVPAMYHEYLTAMFGDYMQLPPEEKRKIHYRPEINKKSFLDNDNA